MTDTEATLFLGRVPSPEPPRPTTVELGLREIFPHLTVNYVEFRSAGDAPSFVQLLADAVTWSTVLKATACVFFAAYTKKIAERAADATWEKRDEVARVVVKTVTGPFRSLVQILKRDRPGGPHGEGVLVGVPIPDDYWATVLVLPAHLEGLLAVTLAAFVSQSQEIQTKVEELVAAGVKPIGRFNLLLAPDYKFHLCWEDESGSHDIEVPRAV